MLRSLKSALVHLVANTGQMLQVFGRNERLKSDEVATGPPGPPDSTSKPSATGKISAFQFFRRLWTRPRRKQALRLCVSPIFRYFRPQLEHLELKLAPAGGILSGSVIEFDGQGYGITKVGDEQVIVGSITGSDGYQDGYVIRINQTTRTETITMLPENFGIGDYIPTDVSGNGTTISQILRRPGQPDLGLAIVNGIQYEVGSGDNYELDTHAHAAWNGGVGGFTAGGSLGFSWDPVGGLKIMTLSSASGSVMSGSVWGASSDGQILGGYGILDLVSIRNLVWNNGVLTIVPGTGAVNTTRDVSPNGQYRFGSTPVFDEAESAEMPVATREGPNNEKLLLKEPDGKYVYGELWGGTNNGWMVGASAEGIFLFHESWTSVRYLHELLQTEFGISVDQLTYNFLHSRAEIQFDGENLNIVMAGESKSYAVQIRVEEETPPTVTYTLTGQNTSDSITFRISSVAPNVTEIIIDLRGGNDNLTVIEDVSNRRISVRILGGDGNDTVRWLVSTQGSSVSSLSSSMIDAFVDLGNGNDRLLAAAARSNVNFTVNGGIGNDEIQTGAGMDSIIAGAGNDTVSAGAGNDTIEAGDGNDLVSGGDGDDRIDGGKGVDLLLGDGGDDTLYGGSGLTLMWGGAGKDTFLYDPFSIPLILDYRPGIDVLRRK